MHTRSATGAVILSLSMIAAVQADDSDVAAGEQLYTSQCKICHGSASAQASGPARSQWQVAFTTTRSTATDIDATALGLSPADERTAFAPPFGPNLRGVYGRPAGSVAGFDYSSVFLKTLKGMEWNEAALDVWITAPQAWVPGVYMFYKQRDPEVRRKIIEYLKANR